MELARTILIAAGTYGAIGLIFAAAFVSVGVARVDPAARGAPVGFRILIFPGAAALWPILWRKWRSLA